MSPRSPSLECLCMYTYTSDIHVTLQILATGLAPQSNKECHICIITLVNTFRADAITLHPGDATITCWKCCAKHGSWFGISACRWFGSWWWRMWWWICWCWWNFRGGRLEKALLGGWVTGSCLPSLIRWAHALFLFSRILVAERLSARLLIVQCSQVK